MADKFCPIFVASESHRQLCRGEDCQLWWFCQGPDPEEGKGEEDEWIPSWEKTFPQSAKTEEEPPLARLVLTGDAKDIAEIAEAVKQIYGAH